MSGIDIECVLRDHYDPATCVREHGMRGDVPMVEAHVAHVAAVLHAQIEGALAEAWDEGNLSGGYWGTTQAYPADVDPPSDNPYRAAHLSDTERAGGAG